MNMCVNVCTCMYVTACHYCAKCHVELPEYVSLYMCVLYEHVREYVYMYVCDRWRVTTAQNIMCSCLGMCLYVCTCV
jgi:hypothetical protein